MSLFACVAAAVNLLIDCPLRFQASVCAWVVHDEANTEVKWLFPKTNACNKF